LPELFLNAFLGVFMKDKLDKVKSFLTDVSVFKKLLVTPAILFILILIIATIAIFSIISQKNNLTVFKQDVLEKQLFIDNLALEVSDNINTYNYLLLTNANENDAQKIQTLRDKIVKQNTNLKQEFEVLVKDLNKNKHKKLAEKVKNDFNEYSIACDNVLNTFEFDAVTASIFLSTASMQYGIVKEDLDKIGEEYDKNGKNIYNGMVIFSNSVVFIFIIALLAVLAIGGTATFVVAGMITQPLNKIIKSIERDENNNIQIKTVEVTSNDEIGVLATVLNDLTQQVKDFINGVNVSANEVLASSETMSLSSEQTAQGAQQAAISTAQLAQGAQDISKNVEDGASNMNKLNKVIQGVLEEAKTVAKLGNDTETNASAGTEYVKKAVDKIDSIKTVSEDISVNIAELGKLSSEIEQIVDLIKNIAGQTNLLALNAAIEAARAGEHGKGFAVVADEVKKLAGQSADATEKITSMIKEIQKKTGIAVTTMDKAAHEVEEGVFVINDAGKALENIISQVKSANVKIQGITKDIGDVAKNSEETVQMIENIAFITEQTASSAEEISSIAEEQTASLEEISANSQTLAGIAEKLTRQVAVFKI
jgi:methyl-accepting chemotaxis protein